MPRILTLSHGHPEFSHGGAEVAAYAMHRLLKGAGPDWHSVFVARADRSRIGHDGETGAFRGRPDEILVSPPDVDGFFFQSLDRGRLFGLLDELVDYARPDLVHAHHFTFWGLDVIDYFHRRGIPTVLTLHEYIAICNRFGQMLKTNGRLCHRSSPVECNGCFPEITSGMFFLRDRLFLDHFARVTRLVSPSAFLAGRVEQWSGGRFSVEMMEDPRDLDAYEPVAAPQERGDGPFRLGYFGQINPFKGTEVLLDAMALAIRRDAPIRLRLFGANLDIQEPAFRERIGAKVKALGDAVEFFGPYENRSVLRLMDSCDAIVVPSIWWENSPVVIQEAIQAKVPVIASQLGGMAEKLADYPGAVFFEPASPLDLAEKLVAVAGTKARHQHAGSAIAGTAQQRAGLTAFYNSLLGTKEASNVSVEFLRSAKRIKKSVRQE